MILRASIHKATHAEEMKPFNQVLMRHDVMAAHVRGRKEKEMSRENKHSVDLRGVFLTRAVMIQGLKLGSE